MKRITMHRLVRAGLGVAVVLCLGAGAATSEERVMKRVGEERKPERVDVREAESALVMHRVGRRPVLDLLVNGQGPYRFYFDTGASGSVISAELAKELGARVVGKQRIGAPGTDGIEVDIVHVDSLTLGGVTVHGLSLTTIPEAMLPKVENAPRGIFSARELPGMLVTLDFAGDRLLLAAGSLPEPDGRTVLGFEAPHGIPELPLRIGGVEFTADLDTGAPGEFSLPLARAAELPLVAAPVEVGKGRRVGGEVTIYEAQLKGAVELGAYTFENPTLKFTDVGVNANIGSGLLDQYTLTIDRDHRRLRLLPNPAPGK